MKHPGAYYLLLLYCTLMVKCAVPVTCDALSHLFNEEAHIATVHAIYGSHHLQTEVAGAVSDMQGGKHTIAGQDEPTVVHTCPAASANVPVLKFLLSPRFCLYAYPRLCSISLLLPGEPPESC